MGQITGASNRVIAVAVLLLFCSTTLTGCASFRRKFVRHSKDKEVKEDIAPVLEPLEYQRVETSPMDAYRSHYAMVRAYFSDVYTALSAQAPGEKRERYLLGQIMAHLQGMSLLLGDARKPEALKLSAALEEAGKELDKPAGLRRYDLLRSSLHKVETDIRRTLKPDMVKEFIVIQ